jgi:signal transduction histidine kinase
VNQTVSRAKARAILRVDFRSHDLTVTRSDIRLAGELVGLENLQQARLSTALSEIVRNAVQYAGGGELTLSVGASPRQPRTQQCLVAVVRDQGPGIADIPRALRGDVSATGRAAMGIPGSGRLVDRMAIEAGPSGGTVVTLEMDLPKSAPELGESDLGLIAKRLSQPKSSSAFDVMAQQNRELLQIHQQLREKQVELEKADERKNQFVTTLAHELRNPLGTLELNIEILRRRPELGPDNLLKRLDTMGRQTRQLTQLVEDLLDVARVRRGKIELRKVPVDLNAMASQAVEMTAGAIAARAHDIQLQVGEDALWVNADATRLLQVISNLIQNAARYTPRKGKICIAVKRQNDTGVVEVHDNGIGIPADLLPHIFELFMQGDAKRSGVESGLGIGLTLVQRLVAEHGGRVAVSSEGVDKGSTFTVALPLIAAP